MPGAQPACCLLRGFAHGGGHPLTGKLATPSHGVPLCRSEASLSSPSLVPIWMVWRSLWA